MFNLSYDSVTGAIMNYNEGPADSLHTPDGCIGVSFAAPIAGMFHSNGSCLMKIDIDTGKLTVLNPIEIPDPIQNPPNAAK